MAYEYKKSDIEKMQNDAIKRVMDMQARSKANNQSDENKTDATAQSDKANSKKQSTGNDKANSSAKKSSSARSLGSLLSGFGGGGSSSGQKSGFGTNILKMLNLKDMAIDKDKSIILMVLILLASEDADELLLLALIYIML